MSEGLESPLQGVNWVEIMSLGDNLRALRKKKGWTQQELAIRTGIKLAHISTLEGQDSDPKLSTLYKLMEALGCTPNNLLLSAAMEEGDIGFKSHLEQAQRLPARDRAVLVEVIKKFISADYVRLAGLVDVPDEDVEGVLLDMHSAEDNETIDGDDIRNDLEKVQELKDERDGPI